LDERPLAESEQNPKRSKKLNPNLEGTRAEFWNSCEGQSAGAYLLVKHLSGLANSAVYAAVSGQASQPLAIKLLRIDGPERERRLSAWSALLSLSHPHLIRVFEAGQCEIDGVSLLYLVMERADGDLAGVLAERSLIAVEAYETLDPALEALTYLHERGYVYGGLKPSRILAIGQEVKLSSDCITRSGSVSPEGDVWSLGATLVQALAQNSPEPDPGGADPVIPASLPEPFLTIARNCLRRDPKSRWSLAQIASHLRGSQFAPSPAPTNTERENRRPRMFFYWITAAALAGCAIFILFARNRIPSPTPSRPTLSQPPPAVVSPQAPPRPEPVPPPRKATTSSDNWFVVVATYARKEDAEKRARTIERLSPPLKGEVYTPRSAKPYYLVVIGSNLSEKAAMDLRARAERIAADAYITRFSP
jgi:serine/threonine protein kinase